MISNSELKRRAKISHTMKQLRANSLPPWNKGKKCPNISESLKGRVPWNKGTHGKMGLLQNHPNWKGGKNIDIRGYVRIYKPNHPKASSAGYVYEHRQEMERFLNRSIKSHEHIHHLNGNKLDNQIENLSLVSNPEHNKIHWPHGFNPKRKYK